MDGLNEAPWLKAAPVKPGQVIHYSMEHPAGRVVELPPPGLGGGFEAFIAEMRGFTTAVHAAATSSLEGDGACGGGDGGLPHCPAYSAGEVEIAHALYRSVKSGTWETTSAHEKKVIVHPAIDSQHSGPNVAFCS